MSHGDVHRDIGPVEIAARTGGKGATTAVGRVPLRGQTPSSAMRRKMYGAEITREQLETQHASLEKHQSLATRDLSAQQVRLESVTKLLQELCRSEAAALMAERKRNCALADLLLAMRCRRQHCLLLNQGAAEVGHSSMFAFTLANLPIVLCICCMPSFLPSPRS